MTSPRYKPGDRVRRNDGDTATGVIDPPLDGVCNVYCDRHQRIEPWREQFLEPVDSPLQEGMRVRHETLGEGTVFRCNESDRVRETALVAFDSSQEIFNLDAVYVEPIGLGALSVLTKVEPKPDKTLREKRGEYLAGIRGESHEEVLDGLDRIDREHFDSKRKEVQFLFSITSGFSAHEKTERAYKHLFGDES